MGERGVWDDVARGVRARRELCVIDERETASPSKSGELSAPESDGEANGDAHPKDAAGQPKAAQTPVLDSPNVKPDNDTLSTHSRVSEAPPQVDVAA